MTRKSSGKIDLNYVKPEVHEYATYLILAKCGKDIELIPASTKYKTHSPDFKMDGLLWELKCPQGKGKYLIRDTLKCASKQSQNVLIDLSRIKIDEEKALGQLNKYFLLEKNLRKLLIITKNRKLLDIQK